MPRTPWLLAAAAALPLLVPSSAMSGTPGQTATEISSAKVCGVSECREVSDPKAATALAVGPFPRGRHYPERGLPWYTGTFTIPAGDGGDLHAALIVVPSAGLLQVDGDWVAMPSRSKAAYAKLTAGLKPRPARTLPGTFARVVDVLPPSAATPASDGSNVWIVALVGGGLAALLAGLLLWIRHRRASTAPAPHV
jgi:hypothetical protein